MMGIMDLLHVAPASVCALAGDLLKLPVKTKKKQHVLYFGERVTYTEAALEKYRAREDGTKGLYRAWLQMAR
jgi:hypothetical protein